MSVGLHDIHFGTPLTTNPVGIAIVGGLWAATEAWVPTPVSRWPVDQVKCYVASAPDLAKVHIETQRLAKKTEGMRAA